uniref:probable transcription factor At1g11510 n=1 Tax=Erigeron canadensis TaxID=72917 RepID=UPI001CB9829E|nr:probable transcription factor At1g11510 [Erigeron canadensis]
MAPKQPESNPNHSSSSEEEDEEEEEATGSEDSQSESQEASDSDSGENKQTPDQKTLISQTPSKPTNNLQNPDQNMSESEEESGSDTDSDDSPPKTTATAAGKAVSAKPISMKRPAPVTEKSPVLEVKKAKKDGSGDDDSKKQLFQRLWSEEDEIVILKGMIDYNKENGESPVNDIGAFHDLIKKSLSVDVKQTQLSDKIRRLKKKFVNNVGKEKDGKDRSFSKSHDQKCYDLSKLIWGGGMESKKKAVSKNGGSVVKVNVASGSGSVAKLNGGVDRKGHGVVKVEEGMDVNRFVRYGGNEGPVLVEEIVKGGMELVGGSKRKELEEKWKALKRQELVLCVKRMDLFKEQALVVIDAVNSSDN